MSLTRRSVALGSLGLLSSGLVAPLRAQHSDFSHIPERSDALGTAINAYVYGYPLVTMEFTRRVLTNVTRG